MSQNTKPLERAAILSKLAADLKRGDVSFPTGAQIALKLLRTLEDPTLHVDQAVRLIQAEPLIAAKAVATANSVAYNPAGREVSDVRAAVARLGFRTLRSLTAGVVAKQMAGRCEGRAAEMAEQLWEHTANVGAMASVLARRLTGQDSETALFVGLVHEIGGFYLISRAGDFPGILDNDAQDWPESGEAELAMAVLSVIGAPNAVLEAIAAYWHGQPAMPPTTLGDTLLLADELAPVRSPLAPAGRSRFRHGDAAGAIYLLEGEASLQAIIDDSAEVVASLVSVLKT